MASARVRSRGVAVRVRACACVRVRAYDARRVVYNNTRAYYKRIDVAGQATMAVNAGSERRWTIIAAGALF